ncbi:dual specificity protein phosphatase family protein [Candidatus Liberibacter sp.]|uniref:dual specificity protein phosphatase family protein n=1 Tax=Candidatus Liberibacter sp. TaxID=34022 RepID=UPI0015F64406|nr:dual specificity protein phosphatase family protein [Candidatus Liberibacter sp.]MBA5723713.1 dual specificity protein phosphatase family protein [Candidatus Liberibacter sp.]
MRNLTFKKGVLKRLFIILTLLPILSYGLFFLVGSSHRKNFHEVLPGIVYRSAQPDDEFIEYLWKNHAIKSIINLREDTAEWYTKEEAISRKLGIKLLNFPMSPSKELNEERIRNLVSLMSSAPKPLLIHCKGGADRTGLASALYLYFIAPHNHRSKADRQLSIFYGHNPFLYRAVDNSFKNSKKLHFDDIPAYESPDHSERNPEEKPESKQEEKIIPSCSCRIRD